MKKTSKRIFLAILSLMVIFSFVFVGCNGKKSGKMKDYFGASVDGVLMTEDWNFSDTTFETANANDESVIFSKNMLSDYVFSYSVKIKETNSSGDALLGAYAYYVDADNYVKFNIDPVDKTITIKWSSGFDSAEKTSSLDSAINFNDYVAIKVEKVEAEFKFFINGKVVQGRTYDFEDSAQIGFINNYVSTIYKDFVFEDVMGFSKASIETSTFKQLTRDAGAKGTWTKDGDTITNDCSNVWETYLFESMSNKMVIDLDFTMTEKVGNEPLSGVSLYLNDTNWLSLFISGEHAEMYLCEKSYAGWTGAGKVPNYTDIEPTNLKIEKIGSQFAFYINDVLFKYVNDETFANANFAIETKHSKQTIKINRFEEIDEFSGEYDFGLMSKTNFASEYVDGAYVFKNSTGGVWGGDVVPEPGLEGGLHLALGNVLALNYTFETIVTLSKAEKASGLVGIVAFYEFLGNGLYLLIDSQTGDIDLMGTAITGSWNGDKKNVSLYDLEIDDEIPIKVVKKAGKFTFYINDIKAIEFTHAYYSVAGSFGFAGTSPTAGSDTTGQFGATFSGVRFKTDNLTYKYGANDHRFTAWNIVEKATCENEGLKTRTCHDCDEVEEEKIDKLDHDLSDWIIDVHPTYEEEGLRYKTCSICEERIIEETLPKKTNDVNLTAEAKENYSYSIKLSVSSIGQNAYVGGYVFYIDDSNNVVFKIDPTTNVLSIITMVENVETERSSNLFALDYENGITVLVEKVGEQYQLAINGKLVDLGTLATNGLGKSGWISQNVTVQESNLTFEDLTAFTQKDIAFGVNDSVLHIADENGTWEVNGNTIISTCYASYETLFFNYKEGVNTVGVKDFSLKVIATQGENHPNGDGRTGFRIYKDNNHFVDAYYINKGNVGDIVYYGAFGGNPTWILQGENGYYDDIPNFVESEPVTMGIEKIGDTINFYANGVFVRSMTSSMFGDSVVGIVNKHNTRSYTVVEYKTLNELTPVTYGLLAGTNMAKTNSNGTYTFETSQNSYWAGALEGKLEGGVVISLVNKLAYNYTFESKVKVATESTSSGITGVLGFWNSGSNLSWLEIDKDGNIVAYTNAGYEGEVKKLSDFGLTINDEIPVKVIKTAGKLEYYVNGILGFTVEKDGINNLAHFGFFGTLPVVGSGTTGQYGAQYKIVSVL